MRDEGLRLLPDTCAGQVPREYPVDLSIARVRDAIRTHLPAMRVDRHVSRNHHRMAATTS
jgi:hypothetical protein